MISIDKIIKKGNLGLKGYKIITLIEVKAFLQNKNLVYLDLVQPVLYFLFLVMGIGGLIGEITINGTSIAYPKYALTGIFAIFIIGQMSQTIYRTTIDKRWGLLPLKMYNGVQPFYYVLGMSTYPIIRFAVQCITLYLVSLVAGMNIPLVSFVGAILVGVVALLFWSSIGILITIYIKNYQQRDLIITLGIAPLSFMAPVFFSLESVPLYIKYIALLNPLTYQITAIRAVSLDLYSNIYIIVTIFLTLTATIIVSIVLNKTELTNNEK